jgi:hypothetical protein
MCAPASAPGVRITDGLAATFKHSFVGDFIKDDSNRIFFLQARLPLLFFPVPARGVTLWVAAGARKPHAGLKARSR